MHRKPLVTRRATWIIPTCALGALVTTAAHAEPTEAEKRTAAEAIFEQAKDLMGKKDYASACPKLEEVVQLQPMGVGAKITLADCYIGQGKLASAHAMLGEAASLAAKANQLDRASSAQDKAQSLEPRLSKMTIAIPNALANTPGLTVVRDGSEVTQALYNVTVPIDGGQHTIVARAPHMKPFEAKLDVPPESGAVTVNVVLLPEAGPSQFSVLGPVGQGGQGPMPARESPNVLPSTGPTDESGSFWSPIRIGGFVVGGVGLVACAAGIGVGVDGAAKTGPAADAFNAAKAKGDIAGENAALVDHANAHNQAVAGWVTTGIGGAVAVAGIVMIAAAPRAHATAHASLTVAPMLGAANGVAALGSF